MMVNNLEYDTSITIKEENRVYWRRDGFHRTRFKVLARNGVPFRLAIEGYVF